MFRCGTPSKSPFHGLINGGKTPNHFLTRMILQVGATLYMALCQTIQLHRSHKNLGTRWVPWIFFERQTPFGELFWLFWVMVSVGVVMVIISGYTRIFQWFSRMVGVDFKVISQEFLKPNHQLLPKHQFTYIRKLILPKHHILDEGTKG